MLAEADDRAVVHEHQRLRCHGRLATAIAIRSGSCRIERFDDPKGHRATDLYVDTPSVGVGDLFVFGDQDTVAIASGLADDRLTDFVGVHGAWCSVHPQREHPSGGQHRISERFGLKASHIHPTQPEVLWIVVGTLGIST